MRRVLIAALCGILASCGHSAAGTDDDVVESRDAPDPDVVWKQLPDGSFGWFHEDSDEDVIKSGGIVEAERCWRSSGRFACVSLWRLIPGGLQVDLDRHYGVTSFYRDDLQRVKRFGFERGGYGCDIYQGTYDSVREGISLNNGAELQNRVSKGTFTDGKFWGPEFTRKFVSENDPSTAVIWFNCAAVRDLLDQGNEAAFLTTAMNSDKLGLQPL